MRLHCYSMMFIARDPAMTATAVPAFTVGHGITMARVTPFEAMILDPQIHAVTSVLQELSLESKILRRIEI